MPVLGLNCQAIMESRHVDVLEMDAASHNGVDDIRQINDAVRYAPVSARYKVYILDEVHMLSNQAFNALLKTLEEPPPHAKFVFATTDIGKVPVTVLSRCQRFDLRRVEAGVLVAHLEGILAKEGVAAEPEALALIARAAEGSVRDSLSLLDQAISHAAGAVRAEDVRQMLGLADAGRIIDLFDALMRGDAARALGELRSQYDSGADPLVVLTELAEFTHFVTRVKVVPSVVEDRSLSEVERKRGRELAAGLSMRVLSRTWQMLFKGLTEVKDAPRPIAAAEMVLVRIAYAADLPPPDEVIRSLTDTAPRATPARTGGAAAPSAAPASYGERARSEPMRSEPVRTSARPALAPAAMPQPRDPIGRAAETAPAAMAFSRFADLIAFANERRDLPLQDLARARRAARPFRGRQAGDRAGAVGIEGADRRSRPQAHRSDGAALDGGGLRRSRPAHPQGTGGGAAHRVHRRRAERSGGADRAGAFSRRPDRRGARARPQHGRARRSRSGRGRRRAAGHAGQ